MKIAGSNPAGGTEEEARAEMPRLFAVTCLRIPLCTIEGCLSHVDAGQDLVTGMRVQRLAPAGKWRATTLVRGGSSALLDKTVSHGFHPSGFELATKESIGHLVPEVQESVRSLMAVTER